MGVPVLNILFGFVVGWYGTRRAQALYRVRKKRLPKIFIYSLFCAGVTLAIMLAIWGRTIPMIFDPAADLANFGHPMILFDPRISFIGWLVLMIVISPFLQLMASIFSAFITLMAVQPEALKE
ncbi:MAG: hypothetical protein KAI62_07050 [Actinomycetia bacterium]|nr:hypothetical protein [Actinomycetes bacterium]